MQTEKNFNRIRKVLIGKLEKSKGVVLYSSIDDFLGEEGKRFFDIKGVKSYLRTARGFYKRLNEIQVV